MTPRKLLIAALALSAFSVHAETKNAPANNSAVNERDRASQATTPEDQSQAKSDVELAARIRRAVLDQPNLSVDGQNIKIITRNNMVTLRGPVKDATERSVIEKTVRTAAGKAKVDSQLEVR